VYGYAFLDAPARIYSGQIGDPTPETRYALGPY
jgi:hypothetical protein